MSLPAGESAESPPRGDRSATAAAKMAASGRVRRQTRRHAVIGRSPSVPGASVRRLWRGGRQIRGDGFCVKIAAPAAEGARAGSPGSGRSRLGQSPNQGVPRADKPPVLPLPEDTRADKPPVAPPRWVGHPWHTGQEPVSPQTPLSPSAGIWHTPPRMDAPPPKPRLLRRRTLLRLAAGGAVLGLSAEAVRVFALTNQHTVIPGRVYRSAQLGREELGRVIAEKKIRTVINLRGTCPETEWYTAECEATAASGISQEDVTLSAKRLPAPAEVCRVIVVLDRTETPVLIHCQ